jgi:hypothetical protein
MPFVSFFHLLGKMAKGVYRFGFEKEKLLLEKPIIGWFGTTPLLHSFTLGDKLAYDRFASSR